jgi:uncharacterized short protein YbdD (DUF466 family)
VTVRGAASTLLRAARRAADVARTVIGAPDYARYLRHVREHHPGRTPLSREAFTRDALARRYERPGSRCC